MNRLPASLRLPRESLIDPTWPQHALALHRDKVPWPRIAKLVDMPFERVRAVLFEPMRIDRVGRMLEWRRR